MWSMFAEICIAIGNILKKFIEEEQYYETL